MTTQQYRAAVYEYRAKRGEPDRPAIYEMCIAGWMPAPIDRLQMFIEHPMLGLSVRHEELRAKHFALMGEPLPESKMLVHPCEQSHTP